MSVVTEAGRPVEFHWLRGRRFDLWFIVGLPAAGLLAGSFVTLQPAFFWAVLVFDLWFLGYHHVVSTYTRLCFDKQSFRDSRVLIFVLLPLVAVLTLIVAFAVGIWAIVTIYFYWQWFHYARQSWGISRAYRAKEPDALYEQGWLDQAIFYALPVLGILYRSYQDPAHFIGLEIHFIPVPLWVVSTTGAITTLLLAYWVYRRVQAWRANRLAGAHTLYMLTHFAIFAGAYLLIEDVTFGWLAINIWHNGQYILFVWMFNTRRFGGKVDPEARFLSYISQPQRLWLYLLVCVAITGIVYWAVLGALNAIFFAGLSMTIVLYQIVNFHHYVVDAIIWKRRKPGAPVQPTAALH